MNFYITSPKSNNRKISLVRPFSDPEIRDWELRDNKSPREIILYGEKSVYCVLKEEKQGFRGRDVRGGWTILRPEPKAREVRKLPNRPSRAIPKTVNRRIIPVTESQPIVDRIVDGFQKTKPTAIAVVGCNRPSYMRQVIEGLKRNELEQYDVYLFLDKPKAANQYGLTQAQMDMGLTDRIVTYPINYGCGRTLIDVRRQIFDRMGYEKAFIFEDDMVPSDHYLTFCENLLEWGQSQWTNIGAVQGWSKCLLPGAEKYNYLDQIHVTYTNWWGYLMTKAAWDASKQYIYDYKNTYLLGDYAVRSSTAILKYFRPQATTNFKLIEGGLLPDETSLKHRRSLFDGIPSGQDGATWLAFDKAKFVRLAPTVNRALYIGKEGIHSTAQIFAKQRFDRMTMEAYDSDKEIRNFKMR